ncbi:hypothetical protein FISHEDRAFT_66516 [Fistulina hepatica ATCC 64428]|uniref:Inositol-1-monophosphatase n=1 Tax=Fistulina hepatica ATCC 64428 TaxID=1128425 RepID=A0A0D7A8K6_9AGAR|nr:hypothetical protein FISHEDRAFT_66516 [Fistulina hepatica ATCC 64428]
MAAELTPDVLQTIHDFAIELCRTAGDLIREGSAAIRAASTSDVNEKKNSVDLVTEYDVRVEELVIKKIAEKYPAFKFIGEESWSAGKRPTLTDEPTFCVDPIDGTTNFVHGFPFACISLALIYKKTPVIGVVYNPFLEHLYTGIKGKGSYLTRGTSAPLKLPLTAGPKPLPSLSQGLIAVEWGSDRAQATLEKKAQSFYRLAGDPVQGVQGGRMAHSLRSMGSAALNFCMVAQGGLDMYWEIGCYPWDVAAGVVIAEEAGGLCTGSHELFAATKDTSRFGVVEEDVLLGRKYLVIRGIAPGAGETSKDAQRRLMEGFYATVDDVDPN